MSASYNDWESDLSSIIEKTNQNLKLLRRIGEKRTDDVSTTRPSSMSIGNASDLRTAVHHRYAAEDAASYRPRVMSSASTSGRKHATAMGDPRLGGGNAGGVGLRASTMLDSRRSEANYDSDDLHSSSRTLRRSASRTDGSKTLKSTSAATIRVHEADMPSDIPNYVLDEIKKSLEVNISSRSSVIEKRIGDLRTDFTVLTNETTQLSHKFAELRDSVMAKMNNVPGVLQSLQENTDAITRLEKHSSALLGWKVSMDQDFFEIASKVKSFASLQSKMATLESNLESLATALRNRPRHDEKIEELRDKLATVERHQSSFVDMKAVENLLNIRLPREFHELEGRMSQSIAFVSEKVEARIQNLEKSLQSQRADSMASLKSELVEDIQRLSATSLRKTDIVPLQNAQGQLKEDLLQLNGFLDRQDKRIQDFKQSSTQIREELLETKQELTKALHAQQGRVTATLEEKIAQLSIMSKEKNVKVDQQMAILSKKQKKVEEDTKTLHEDITKVRQDVLHKQNTSHVAQQKENEKLRQRLARSVAELETLTLAKMELERRYGKQEKQFQANLKALHAKLEENEKLKESERLELVQKIQEETKLMGIAQGKNALLETLLAKEKLQNAEKNDLIHKSRQEMNLVRQKMRTFEAEVEVKMHKLATELHSKQVQVDTLVKKLKKSEEDAAKLLETTKRDAKSFRRAKVTKEHELSIAKLKLKEMEKAASAMAISQSNGVKETSKQAPDASKKSVEEAEAKRKEMEQLLLDSQLQVDELNQEIDEMRKEHDMMKKQQCTSLEEHVSKLSSDYEVKILALNAAVAAKDQAMSRLRDSLVERSELDAVDEQLQALKDEKKSLLSTIERSYTEQAHIIQEHEAKSQAHDKEMDAMKRSLETRLGDIEEARAGFERFKANIAKLEDQLKDQESSHAEELASLMDEIKEARASITACTAEVEELRLEKLRLEHEMENVQSKLENLRSGADERDAKMNEKLAEQEIEMQNKLGELSSQLEGKERELGNSKQVDERNRRTLSEMVLEQEQMESRLRTEIDSLSFALEHERENSKTREQESEFTILALQSELDMIKLDSHAAKTSYQSTVVAEIAELTGSLKESQRREQQLQERLVSILKEIAQASSTFNADTQVDITGNEDDDALAVKYLGYFCATQRGTVMELENLQADYEMAMKQAAEDAAAIQDLDAQTKVYSTQIQDLQAVVKQLESKLKEQYATSAKQSEDLEQEIATLRKQKSDLERIIEIKSSECDEKQALFDRQLESKQEQVEVLRQENEKMSATMESIRAKMENIDASKARELDEMSAALAELEARASSHTVKAQDGIASELDKNFYANHHETLALAQSIRSLQLKLTKSVGMMEWHDLKASVFEEEDKLERLRKEKNREVTKLGSAEDEILLNADFLKAVLSLRGSKGSNASDDWTSKYVKTAPEMVEKLKNLESRLQEVMAKHHTQTLATENGLSQRDGTKMERSAPDSPMQIDTSDETRPQKARRDLSESRESDELLEESQEVLERDDDFDEQSFEGSLDESGILSDSAALNESSLDLSAREDGLDASLYHTGGETSSRLLLEDRRSTDDRRERVDPCMTLLLANTPSELLSTSSVRSPIRQSEPAMSSLDSESREDSELNSRANDELDESHEDVGTSSNSESADVSNSSTSHLGKQFVDDAGASSHLASGCGDEKERIRHNDNTDLSSMADPIHFDNASDSDIDEASVRSDAVGDNLHEEMDDVEHSFDSPQDVIHHDDDRSPVATASTQGLSTESSVIPPHPSNSKPVKAASPDLQEHEQTRDGFAGDKKGTQVDFEEGDEDCDINSEEELEESQDEKLISEREVHAESCEPRILLEESSKPTSDFDEPDDYVEQSEGDESADLEGRSHKPASTDSDFRMENVERADRVLSLGLRQSQYDDDHDQGFHRVDAEHGSDMEGESAKASVFKPKDLVQDDFEGTVRDPSFHDTSFDSHESDEENLSEFEHFQREQTVRNAESTSLNAVTGSSSHDGEEAFATSRLSYRMEEEESEENDDMDEVERMLLVESQDSYPHSNVKRHNEEGRHGGSGDDDEDELDDSAEVERTDMAESSFDDDVDVPSIKLPSRGDDLDLKQDTHELLKGELSADGSMQSGMGKALHDDNHREYSCDIDDDEDLMDESVEEEPTQPGLGELKLGDSHEGNGDDIKTRGLLVDTTRGDDTIQQRGLDRRVGENTTEENDESDNENSADEDQFESSFGQVPSATVDNAGDDQKNLQDIANDSSIPAAVPSSLSSRSALSKHMSFSISQVDDGDEDEVEQLMREQSGFASQRPNVFTSKSPGREARRQDDEVEEQDDDELIDSESDEGEELSFDGSADDEGKLGANYHNTDPGPQEASPYEDGAIAGDLHSMSRTETSLDTMARTAGMHHDQRLSDSHDDPEGGHEDPNRHSDRGTISDSSEDDSAEHRDAAEEEDSVDDDGEVVSALGELSKAEKALEELMQSHDENEQDTVDQSNPKPSIRNDDEESSNEEDEFEFGSRRMEPSLPAAPAKLQSSQLAPLAAPLSRLGGASALKKALSAASRTFDEDDNMDEVERLMLEQNLARVSKPISSTQSSAKFAKKGDSENEDEDEFRTGFASVHDHGLEDTNDFEEHELDFSARDDHDESFDSSHAVQRDHSSQANRLSVDRQSDSAGSLFNERSLDDLASTSTEEDAFAQVDARREAPTDFKGADAVDGDEESDDEKSSSHNVDREAALRESFHRAHGEERGSVSRSQLGFGLGRRVSLEEENDDMDEVERLLFEQTLMKQQSAKPTGSHRFETTARTEDHIFGAEGDEDDDEFDEAPIEEPMQAYEQSSFSGAKANVVSQKLDVHHNQRLRESNDDEDSEASQEESLDASHEESSFDGAPAEMPTISTSLESSFDEQAPKTLNSASHDQHASLRHRFEDGDAISDSSESDDDETASSRHLAGSSTNARNAQQHTLAPLGSLGSKSLGVGLGRRGALEEENDDMDEVERLLLEQTLMKQQQQTSKQASQTASSRRDASKSDDDEFGEEFIGALMEERDHLQQTHPQASDNSKPLDIAERTQQQQQHRPIDFAQHEGNNDDDDDIDNGNDEERPSPLRTGGFSNRGDFDQSHSASSSPSASSTRIPIFNGSNLADRVATDAIPSMLSQQTTSTSTAVESEIQQQLHHLEHDDVDSEEDKEEEYLEESFDLEESLQDEEED